MTLFSNESYGCRGGRYDRSIFATNYIFVIWHIYECSTEESFVETCPENNTRIILFTRRVRDYNIFDSKRETVHKAHIPQLNYIVFIRIIYRRLLNLSHEAKNKGTTCNMYIYYNLCYYFQCWVSRSLCHAKKITFSQQTFKQRTFFFLIAY